MLKELHNDKYFSSENRTLKDKIRTLGSYFKYEVNSSMRLVRHWNRLPTEVVGCPSPSNAQGQVGWGCEQPGLVEGDHAHGREVGTR